MQAACILVQQHLARVVQRMFLYRDCSFLVQHPQGLQTDAHAMMQLPVPAKEVGFSATRGSGHGSKKVDR